MLHITRNQLDSCYWTIPKKTNKEVDGLRTWIFKRSLWNFSFFTLPLEIPDKLKLHLWKFLKIVLDPIEIPRPKPRPLEIPHYFLLATVGNFTLFLINSRKFHMIFIWYPWEYYYIGVNISTISLFCIEFFHAY